MEQRLERRKVNTNLYRRKLRRKNGAQHCASRPLGGKPWGINQLVNELIGDLSVDCAIDPSSEQLQESVADEIYQIINEAVTNIKLHAQAERAEIKLDIYPNRIHLFVQDDGRGFSLENITKKPEGLMRIQKCIKHLDAGYEMDTSDLDNGGVAHWV